MCGLVTRFHAAREAVLRVYLGRAILPEAVEAWCTALAQDPEHVEGVDRHASGYVVSNCRLLNISAGTRLLKPRISTPTTLSAAS